MQDNNIQAALYKEMQESNERLNVLNNSVQQKWKEWDIQSNALQRLEKRIDRQANILRSISPIIRVAFSVAIVVVIGLLFPYLSAVEYLLWMGLPIIMVNVAFPALVNLLESLFGGDVVHQTTQIKEDMYRLDCDIRKINTEIEEIKSREKQIRYEIDNEIQRKKAEEERILTEKKVNEFRERIQQEELAADERMAQSELVHEIAQCILPSFKQFVENVDTETHMKVRVRLALEVRKDMIDYYDTSVPNSRKHFVFQEEGIIEQLSPILRKALCKALVTELQMLILEAFPIDPNRKMVQADLENSVVIVSNAEYDPGYDDTAPEYDDNSYAYGVILYQASREKGGLRF